MSTQLDDRPEQIYEDDETIAKRAAELKALEEQFGDSAIADDARNAADTPSDINDLESQFNQPAIDDSGRNALPSLASGLETAQADDTPVSNWRTKGISGAKAAGSKVSGLNSKKAALAIGVAAGGAAIGVLLLLMILLGNLKIVHLAENVTVYNMARTSRTFRQTLSEDTAESIDSEAMSDSRFASLRTRFEDSKIKSAIDTFNSYRPGKVMQQLGSELTPVFEEGPPSRFLKRPTQIFTGYDFDGAFIEKTDPKFFTPIANYADKLRFSAELNAVLEERSYGANAAVRTAAVSQFLEENGIGKLRFWDKNMLAKLTPEAADSITQQQTFAKSRTPRGTCASTEVCDGVQAADDATETTVNNATTDTAATIEENADTAANTAIKSTVSDGATAIASKAFQYTSVVYGVAVPLCLIFDGSIENGKDTINNSESAAMKNFFTVQEAAGEMKKGSPATNSLAVKGLSDKVGNISDSIPMQRASGQTVDTGTVNAASLPQSTNTGTFSLLDVALPSVPKPILDAATSTAQGTCGVLTNVWTGAAVTVGELGLAFLSFGSSTAAEEGASAGVKAFVGESIGAIAKNVGLEQGFKEAGVAASTKALASAGGKLFAKIGLQVGATVGLSELAHLAVLKHMASGDNGLATDETFADQVDMGGNLYAQGVNRTFLYGAPLLPADVAESKVADLAYINDTNSRKPASERYFAISDPSSMVARAATTVSSFISNPTIKLGGHLPEFLTSIVTWPRSLFASFSPSIVHAEQTDTGDYNIVQWGWTNEETNLIDTNPDYAPMENSLILDQSGRADEIASTYGECFTKSDGELFSEKLVQRSEAGAVLANQGLCSPTNLGLHNPKYGDLVMRWRLAKRNQAVLNHLEEIQNAQ